MKEAICCESMRYHTSNHCDVHTSPFDCPDRLIIHQESRGEFGIIIHDGGQSYIRINYCPWCGRKLPDGKLEKC